VEVLNEHLSPSGTVVVSFTQTETLGVNLVTAESQRGGIFSEEKLGAMGCCWLFKGWLRYYQGFLSLQQSLLTLLRVINAESFARGLNALAKDGTLLRVFFFYFSPIHSLILSERTFVF
jgi:hypothetical protein